MLVLLPEAEGEEVDAVMTAALGSMAPRYPGSQVSQSTAAATEAAAADCKSLER